MKRLTDTDLTFFRWHYEHQSEWRGPESGEAKQKAINISADVLRASYPGLAAPLGAPTLPVSLSLIGPAGAAPEVLTRKITRQQKNWRLNGELISNPSGQTGRFDRLRSGDIALFVVNGDAVPAAISLILLAHASEEDRGLQTALDDIITERGATMIAIAVSDLRSVVDRAAPSVDHAVALLASQDDTALAALGEPPPGAGGRLVDRPVFTGRMSAVDLKRARDNQAAIGELGEELVAVHLDALCRSGAYTTYEWTSRDNAISPYDFEAWDVDGSRTTIEVKATSGPFTTPIYMSVNELRVLADASETRAIHRVFDINTDAITGTLMVTTAASIERVAGAILGALGDLPPGVGVGTVSISPALFGPWGDAIQLTYRDEAT